MDEKAEPSRNWRKIAADVGIIVAGVLIALAAEQAAQSFNLRQRTAAAEDAMAVEINNSLLAAAELSAIDRCVDVQIKALQQGIVSGDRKTAGAIVDRGSIFGANRLWADNAFEAALTAQVSDYLGSEKLKRYSQVYDMIRGAKVAQDQREATLSELGTLSIAGLPASPEITYSQLAAVAQLRASTQRMEDYGALITMSRRTTLALRSATLNI